MENLVLLQGWFVSNGYVYLYHPNKISLHTPQTVLYLYALTSLSSQMPEGGRILVCKGNSKDVMVPSFQIQSALNS